MLDQCAGSDEPTATGLPERLRALAAADSPDVVRRDRCNRSEIGSRRLGAPDDPPGMAVPVKEGDSVRGCGQKRDGPDVARSGGADGDEPSNVWCEHALPTRAVPVDGDCRLGVVARVIEGPHRPDVGSAYGGDRREV